MPLLSVQKQSSLSTTRVKTNQLLLHNAGSIFGDFIAVLRPDDIDLAVRQGMIGSMLTVEGGDILRERLSICKFYIALGVRAMTLTWNHRNEIADGIGK